MRINEEELAQIIKEEIEKELKESAASKAFYAPARALSAVERWFRKKTGIRGILDPSVIKSADGKLIMPNWAKLKKQHPWVAKHPALFAVAQAASNVTLGDPIEMLALVASGGVTTKALRKAPQLQKMFGAGANVAKIDGALTKLAKEIMKKVGHGGAHRGHQAVDTAVHHAGALKKVAKAGTKAAVKGVAKAARASTRAPIGPGTKI